MGSAANQARLMTLTARQNDLEYKAQQISAIKMRLSQTTSSLAKSYADALNNYTTLNAAEQIANNYKDSKFVIKNGTYAVVPADYEAQNGETVVDANQLVPQLASALGLGVQTSANGFLTVQQATYTTETERISAQEKIYDMELTQVNTEHNAIKTEYDAIKSLVGDNVEKSFNVFG